MSVYFCFQGDREKGMEDVNVKIPSTQLEGVEDSLLSKLADDTWKTDKDAGMNAANPIMTKPLEAPCQQEWHPDLAGMIVDAYRWHQEKKEWDRTQSEEAKSNEGENAQKETSVRPRLKLPPSNNVELEDALVVLDYYGLVGKEANMDDFDFDDNMDDVQIRALLFIKWVKKSQEAKSFIIESLKKDPKVVTLFLFATSNHDMKFINSKGANDCKSTSFVRVGDEEDCDSHYEWVSNPRLRAGLVSWLEEESGLRAVFMSKNNFYDDSYAYFNSECPHEQNWLNARPVIGGEEWDGMETMHVLRVEVPKAVKRQRIE